MNGLVALLSQHMDMVAWLAAMIVLLGVFPTVAEEFQAQGQVVARRVGFRVQAQRAFVFIDGLIEELVALSLLL